MVNKEIIIIIVTKLRKKVEEEDVKSPKILMMPIIIEKKFRKSATNTRSPISLSLKPINIGRHIISILRVFNQKIQLVLVSFGTNTPNLILMIRKVSYHKISFTL